MKDLTSYISESFFNNVGLEADKIKEFMSKLSFSKSKGWDVYVDVDKFTITFACNSRKYRFEINVADNWEYFEKVSTSKIGHDGTYRIKIWSKMDLINAGKYTSSLKANWNFLCKNYGETVNEKSTLAAFIDICGYYTNPCVNIVVNTENADSSKIKSIEITNR